MSRTLFALCALAGLALAQEGPKKADAPEATARIEVLKVRLDGTEDPHPALPFGPAPLNHHGFLSLVKEIARDPAVDAVELKLENYGVGWARLLEVRAALAELRRSGKKVFVYKENLTPPDLVLGSVADRISVPESGLVALPGLAIESWYMRELFSKLRIRFDVIHIGEYKTAGESFVRDSMSKELKESLDPILDELYASMVKAIAEGRGLSDDAVRGAVDRAILTAKEAKELGLIDRVEYYDQFKDGIRAYFPDKTLKKAEDRRRKKGPQFDPNNPFAFFTVMMTSLFAGPEKVPEGPKVAVVYCTGPIVSGKSQYDWMGNLAAMGSDTIVEAIEGAMQKDDVKAIVLRVNSPGGSALASDMIWRAVERAKERKPVIASMGDVAASGGYYISMNSSAIVAEPQTITGSIGVVGLVPNVDDLYPWIGINPERMTRGKRAAGLLTTKGMDEGDKALLRHLMESIYKDFVAKVAAGRGKTPAEIEPIARGRIWTGRDALARGLVDQLGGLQDAITLARQRGQIADGKEGEDWHVVEFPRRKGPFEFLEEMFETRLHAADQAALARLPGVKRILAHLEALRLVAKDRVCAIHPELHGFATAFADR